MKGSSRAKTLREYISRLPEPRKSDLAALNTLIRRVTKLKPIMFREMIGYGKFHYKYASGREGDWVSVALASQKNYISLYASMAVGGKYLAEKYKSRLAKASIGKSCIRFKRLSDVNVKVLAALLKENHKAYTSYKPA
jgi:hypothetical protein